MRQTLCGDTAYALIALGSLAPRPSFFMTAFMNKLLGDVSFAVSESPFATSKLRVYSACTSTTNSSAIVVYAISLSRTDATMLDLSLTLEGAPMMLSNKGTLFSFTPTTPNDLTSANMSVNGQMLFVEDTAPFAIQPPEALVHGTPVVLQTSTNATTAPRIQMMVPPLSVSFLLVHPESQTDRAHVASVCNQRR